MEFFNVEMSENFVAKYWVQKGTGCKRTSTDPNICQGIKTKPTTKMTVETTDLKLK